ncbi:MAG: YegS/Rv2252/BmrU family lipid kinase [Proteobacteria bacterium]|nr:YegS/Rv2252/BmrU family lipid kinase [Pseudomonadota bacterium]
MKHIFIINPASGKENATEFIQQKVAQAQCEHEIYITKAPGDAIQYIRNYCANDAQPVRFYACGGDGTLNEVVNGAAEFDFASVGCFPCGSGNDFIKYYGGKDPFLDIHAQLNGTDTHVDLIRVNDNYAINAVHFGFDSCVANLITKLRRVPVIGGKNVYPFSVLVSLIIGMYHRCKVEVDGELINPKGTLLLCTIANGQYVGGSYRCAPRSRNDDGLLEVCLFKPLSHIRFAKMMKSYQAGTHLDTAAFHPYFEYKQGKSVHITAPDGFIFSMDGEIHRNNDFVVENMPRKLKFVVPAGATPIIDNSTPSAKESPETV